MNNVKVDSRKITQGDTFLCITGIEFDGHNYIDEAVKNGATTIIFEKEEYLQQNVRMILVESTYDYLIKFVKNKIKNYKIKLIGITGTNGKTTSAYILNQSLNKLGLISSYLGTNGYYKRDDFFETKNTTPSLFELYEIITDLENENYDYLVMEVSSHALSEKRVEGLTFEYCCFTNISHEHLDYHQTIENYIDAKSILFDKLTESGISLVNVDDNFHVDVMKGKSFKPLTMKNVIFIKQTLERTIFTYKNLAFKTSIINQYNISNLLFTIEIAYELGFSYNEIYQVVKELKLPAGRFEKIVKNDRCFVVDYAHTPDSIKKVFHSLKQYEIGKIYCIIGCGGNRDQLKRAPMGKIVTDQADFVVFTSDNPRFEEPLDIIEDMLAEVANENYRCIVNREDAIRYGISLLDKKDVLLVLGKGHEKHQIINDEIIEFNDIEIIEKILKE